MKFINRNERSDPSPSPSDRKKDIMAPATSTSSSGTRLKHTKNNMKVHKSLSCISRPLCLSTEWDRNEVIFW